MKILIVKTSALGDIVHCFPIVSYLKSRDANCIIDWVVEAPFASLVQSHPDVRQVNLIDSKRWRGSLWHRSVLAEINAFRQRLRQEKYDVVFDFQGNIKSSMTTGFAKAKTKVGFGAKTVPEWPNLLFTNRRINPPAGQNIREDYLHIAKSYFGDSAPFAETGVALSITAEEQRSIDQLLAHPHLANRRRILVCPGSAWKNKQLSPQTLLSFLSLVQKQGSPSAFLFVWGNAQEKLWAEQLHHCFASTSVVVDKMRLPALQNLMGRVDLVMAMDSLPLHLAATTLTPTYSVFGASSAAKYKPVGERHAAYQGACPYGNQFEKRCPTLRSCATGACIQALTPEVLFDHFCRTT
jgi:heptosyltransferase-1